LESYTSILPGISKSRLEAFYEKPILIADRNLVESEAETLLLPAKEENVSLLVVGDPLCATTHADIILRARERNIKVEIVHNASIMNAVGSCGLQLYNFGATVSLPFFEENWKPLSFYPKIKTNIEQGMHTLCLLDIKVKEPDFEALTKGRKLFLPPRFMTVNVAIQQLLQAEDTLKEGAYSRETMCVGIARLGQSNQCIKAGKMKDLLTEEFGEPLHSFVVCGNVHDLEMEAMKIYMIDK